MSEAPNSNYLPPKVTYAILGTGNTVDYIRADLVAGMREALEAAVDVMNLMDSEWGYIVCSFEPELSQAKAALEAGKVDG